MITARDLAHASAMKAPFTRAGWIFEIKFDGFRILASHEEGGTMRLLTRKGNDLATIFPEVALAMRELPALVLDGELVILDADGRADFERLRRRQLLSRPEAIERAAREEPALFFAFDLLVIEGRDIRELGLLKRKALLKKAVQGSERVRYLDHVGEEGVKFFQAVEKLGIEGIMAKRADAPYLRGRSPNWVKIETVSGRAPRQADHDP